jgi:ornithine cyclodeaminase/alanine dehydrogenase-like protein (mu-crystallin family)
MRILTDADVRACLPTTAEAVDLAAAALTALADGAADVRPKQGVAVRPGVFSDAMPGAVPQRNLLGLKWISIFPDNTSRGRPTASGVIVLNDALTGAPSTLLPAGTLTGLRTAAVSAATVRALAPAGPVAILGAGPVAAWHVRAFAAVGATPIRVWARRPEQAEALRRECQDVADVEVFPDRRAALTGAATVLTALAIGLTDTRIPDHWLEPHALLVPVDYASSIGPELAAGATLAADDVEQFRVLRDQRGKLGNYPDPHWSTGALLRSGNPGGRVVVQNLGSAVCDLFIAARVADVAQAEGRGSEVDLDA